METVTDIRNLPSIDELGEVESNFIQVNCQRGITADTFHAGVQDFMFNVHGTQRFCPLKSYFRHKLKITTDGVTQPTTEDRIAIAENAVANLYSNCYAYIGNVDVSSLTQFCGQAAMLKHRISKTKSWLESIGRAGYYLVPNLDERINQVSSNGLKNTPLDQKLTKASLGYDNVNTLAIANTGIATFDASGGDPVPNTDTVYEVGDVLEFKNNTYVVTVVNADATMKVSPEPANNIAASVDSFTRVRSPISLRRNEVIILFQPPIGLFSTQSVLPAGAYKLSLQPRSNTIAGVQSDIKSTAGFRLDVTEVQFFMNVFRTEKAFDEGTYYLSLDECNIQQKSLNGNNQATHNFTIPSSTIGIAVFSQSISAGTTALVPPSYFGNQTKTLNGLKHLQITYANVSKPQTDHESSFDTLEQYLTQRYIDTQVHNGLYELSCESFEDWLERGALYYFSWIKSADDRSTELQLTANYSGIVNTAGDPTSIFVATVYRNLVTVTIQSGFVSKVTKLQM